MHAGKLLAQQLENFGTTHIFGVPGESYLPLLDGLLDTKINFINARNESGAAFMAAAWGQLTGNPGIAAVTRGPGASNASIGVHTAMQGSLPMILLIGQVEQNMEGREAFQEVDYEKFYGEIAKAVIEIRDTARIPELLSKAWSLALSGRKGPVVIVLPSEILEAEASAELLSDAPRTTAPAPAPHAMNEVHSALTNAKRPLLIYGGTSWTDDGLEALKKFAERHFMPVMSAFRFQDRFDNHSPVYVGDCGLGLLPHIRPMVEAADLILAVNIRFGENSTDGYTLFDLPKMQQTLIHTHISPHELNKIYQADLAIVSAPDAFAEALLNLELGKDWTDWCAPHRDAYLENSKPPAQHALLDMGAVMNQLQSQLAEDAIITNGAGNFAIWPSKYFRYGAKQRLIAPQSGAMGYGLPAAIACKIAEPERQVICFAGDGDLQMNLSELGTAMQMRACPVILVLNNGSYGTIRMHQERQYKRRVSGTEIENPDFTAIAKAYGFHAERIEVTDDFAPALKRALTSHTGALIELITDIENITPTKTISNL